jgi:hypothetical protein
MPMPIPFHSACRNRIRVNTDQLKAESEVRVQVVAILDTTFSPSAPIPAMEAIFNGWDPGDQRPRLIQQL